MKGLKGKKLKRKNRKTKKRAVKEPKKRKLQLKTDGNAIKAIQQTLFAAAVSLTALPLLAMHWISRSGLPAAPGLIRALSGTFQAGIYSLMTFLSVWLLLSEGSMFKCLAVRKKLIHFTRLFIKPKISAMLYHSVKWQYAVNGKKAIIDLHPNGLVEDTAGMGKKLSEYLGIPLLKYEEYDGMARYVFGSFPKRCDGMALMGEGITKSAKAAAVNYNPIPIYDDIVWDFNSEALHILLIAPSGSGKTWFLTYLAGMVLKGGHKVYVIDAKNSDFARMFRHAGVPVAAEVDEILGMLTTLVQEMEERYAKYFASDNAAAGGDIQSMGLQSHFLFFDEILSVLGYAGKKERAEMERLLGQLALKGRAAGFSIIVTAQKLNATELPKAITEQCQTRFILGNLVSDETFHQATGMYKKDIASAYKGGVGEGYAVTPKSKGLAYIRTPLLPGRLENCVPLFSELKDRAARGDAI